MRRTFDEKRGILHHEGAKDAKGGMVGEAGGLTIRLFTCRWFYKQIPRNSAVVIPFSDFLLRPFRPLRPSRLRGEEFRSFSHFVSQLPAENFYGSDKRILATN